MIEVVYKGRDNPNAVTFKEDDVVIDFSAATRMVLSFKGSDVVADTDVDSTLIDWSSGAGVVVFNLNDLVVTTSRQLPSTLIVYDPLHTNGQVLAFMDERSLYFKFK